MKGFHSPGVVQRFLSVLGVIAPHFRPAGTASPPSATAPR
jgi:hypothetical protein